MKKSKKLIFHIALIIFITSLVYINSFKNEFVFDDHLHILENTQIRYKENIPNFFKQPFMDLYRPLRSIHYMIIYSISKENPIGYHLNSLLLHSLISILIYLITKSITKKINISLITSLIFAVHPIHTGRVTNITASFDMLGILFMLVSLYLYIISKQYSKNKKMVIYFASICTAILALLSSEEAIILPLIIILYELCFNNYNKNKIRDIIKIILPFAIIDILYIILRFFILDIGARSSEYIGGNLYITALTMSKVIIKYITLLISPLNLTLYHNITIATSILNLKVILSIAVMATLIIIAIKSYKHTKKSTKQISGVSEIQRISKHNKIITFIIAWFFITLIPFSNILPLRVIMAERYLYLPSFAFCLLIGILINQIYNLKQIKISKLMAIILTIILIASFSIVTIKRNSDWKDDMTLWKKTVETSPSSSEAHDNLGFSYERAGDIDKAINEFKKSVELNPSNYKAYTNLGTSYAQKENLELATVYLEKAIEIENTYYKAHNYLGLVYAKQGRFNESIVSFKNAIKLNPNFDEAYYNLGIIYEYTEQYSLAKEEFKKAYALNPKDSMYMRKLDLIEY
jgi:Flp pilus assembly protein TadD